MAVIVRPVVATPVIFRDHIAPDRGLNLECCLPDGKLINSLLHQFGEVKQISQSIRLRNRVVTVLFVPLNVTPNLLKHILQRPYSRP